MILGPTETPVVAAPGGCLRGGPFSGRLDPVMPPAERLKVGLSVVVTRSDVVHVGGRLGAAHAVVVRGDAPVAVSGQDAAPYLRPVRRQAKPSVRRSPGHEPPTSGPKATAKGFGKRPPAGGQREAATAKGLRGVGRLRRPQGEASTTSAFYSYIRSSGLDLETPPAVTAVTLLRCSARKASSSLAFEVTLLLWFVRQPVRRNRPRKRAYAPRAPT